MMTSQVLLVRLEASASDAGFDLVGSGEPFQGPEQGQDLDCVLKEILVGLPVSYTR